MKNNDFMCNDFEYKILDDGTAEITDYNGNATELEIPDTIDGYEVTSIGEWAFSDYENLKSVTIPDSVTSIGCMAFCGCISLTSVTIPDSVTSIGEWAFSYCTSLTSVTVPDNVTSIGDDAFYKTAWYNNQPDGLVYAGKVAYKYKGECPATLEIKDGTVGIADYAFYDCESLESITIPDNVTSIGDSAFKDCANLTSITIPDSVTSIGMFVFQNCPAEIKTRKQDEK